LEGREKFFERTDRRATICHFGGCATQGYQGFLVLLPGAFWYLSRPDIPRAILEAKYAGRHLSS
jgi:hypothetical protein